jgi:hypothetical protein
MRLFDDFLIAVVTGIGATGSEPRAVGRDAMKHPFYADVFVDIRPVDTLAGADEAEIRALLGRGLPRVARTKPSGR